VQNEDVGFDPSQIDEMQPEFDFSLPALPEGPVVETIVSAKYMKPRGNQIGGKLLLTALITEGTVEQAGKKTRFDVDLPPFLFDDPPSSTGCYLDDAGKPVYKDSGQKQSAGIRGTQFVNLCTTFEVPRRPVGKNPPAIEAWTNALVGKSVLDYLKVQPEKEEENPESPRFGTIYPERQTGGRFRPFTRIHPSKGPIDELAKFRDKLGAKLVTVEADTDEAF